MSTIFELLIAAQSESNELTARNDYEYVEFLRVLRRMPALSALLGFDASKQVGPIKVATFFEGEFDQVRTFNSRHEAQSFDRGVSLGAGQYGSGSHGVYIIPDEIDDMRDTGEEDQIEKAFKRAGVVLPGKA